MESREARPAAREGWPYVILSKMYLHICFYHNINLALNLFELSRDITLPTKVRLVKAMVFPVVMYGCESWTVKKTERRRIELLNCGVGEDS